jgi:hypothetical protein
VSSQIVVTGKLNITGIPDANGVLPKIIGGGSNRLFKVESGGELVVKYLNLTGGDADKGGAVSLLGAGSIIKATNCVFSFNTVSNSPRWGGAIYVGNYGNASLFNSSVVRNSAAFGGGIFVHDYGIVAFYEGNLSFNSANPNNGGGLYSWSEGYTEMSKLSVVGNTATRGGGVIADSGSWSKVVIKESVFESNIATTMGGGAVSRFAGDTLAILSCKFVDNVAPIGSDVATDDNSATLFVINSNVLGSVEGPASPKTCDSNPTQCADNGYQNAICTTRKNPDEGVICAQNCSTGYEKAGTFNHTCVACSVGTYNPSWNQYQCQPWSDCSIGQYISTNGTNSSDRVCISCESGKFSASTNAYSCTDWTNCVAGQKIASNGTSSSDRTCVTCTTGTFSTATNQNACTNWTTCNATTEVESGAGSTTKDRVCATAGSPTPAGAPSPSGDSPTPAGAPSPSGNSPSPAGSSPSPADAPTHSDNATSSTDAPSPADKIDELSIGSCNQPTWFTTMFLIAWSVLQW